MGWSPAIRSTPNDVLPLSDCVWGSEMLVDVRVRGGEDEMDWVVKECKQCGAGGEKIVCLGSKLIDGKEREIENQSPGMIFDPATRERKGEKERNALLHLVQQLSTFLFPSYLSFSCHPRATSPHRGPSNSGRLAHLGYRSGTIRQRTPAASSSLHFPSFPLLRNPLPICPANVDEHPTFSTDDITSPWRKDGSHHPQSERKLRHPGVLSII